MSRHSHWAKIKRAKGTEDAKRAGAFTKLSRAITVAAREKGTDPAMNFKLRLAIDAARGANMSNDTIDRAVARAGGVGGAGELFEATYEAMGPGGVAFIIEAVTDSRNRTSSNVKAFLSKHGGALAGVGAITWQFDHRGVIRVGIDSLPKNRESFELSLIDNGADDVREEEGGLTVTTPPDGFQKMVEFLHAQNITPEYSSVDWIPKNSVTVDNPDARKELDALTEACDADDDVTNVATNEA